MIHYLGNPHAVNKWCAFTQVALIAALAHAGPDLVAGGDGCRCILLVHPTSTCTKASHYLLQLALVVFSHQPVQMLHLHMWWSLPAATCTGGTPPHTTTWSTILCNLHKYKWSIAPIGERRTPPAQATEGQDHVGHKYEQDAATKCR